MAGSRSAGGKVSGTKMAHSGSGRAPSFRRKGGFMAGTALVIVMGLSSLSAMLGDIVGYQAKFRESLWRSQHGSPVLVHWKSVSTVLERSLWFSPDRPDTLQALGRLYSWAWFIPELASQDISPGLEALRRAIERRPYWAEAMGDMLLLKAQHNQFDGEFRGFMQRALSSGGNEPQVMLTILSAGLGGWGSLEEPQQEQVLQLFEQLISDGGRSGEQALNIAQESGLDFALCLLMERGQNYPLAQRHCRPLIQAL